MSIKDAVKEHHIQLDSNLYRIELSDEEFLQKIKNKDIRQLNDKDADRLRRLEARPAKAKPIMPPSRTAKIDCGTRALPECLINPRLYPKVLVTIYLEPKSDLGREITPIMRRRAGVITTARVAGTIHHPVLVPNLLRTTPTPAPAQRIIKVIHNLVLVQSILNQVLDTEKLITERNLNR